MVDRPVRIRMPGGYVNQRPEGPGYSNTFLAWPSTTLSQGQVIFPWIAGRAAPVADGTLDGTPRNVS